MKIACNVQVTESYERPELSFNFNGTLLFSYPMAIVMLPACDWLTVKFKELCIVILGWGWLSYRKYFGVFASSMVAIKNILNFILGLYKGGTAVFWPGPTGFVAHKNRTYLHPLGIGHTVDCSASLPNRTYLLLTI